MNLLTEIFNVSLLVAMIRTTAPILLAGLGGAFTAKSGIFNIALEGLMLMAAFGAVLGSYYTGSAWLGVLIAVAIAVAFSLLFALFVVSYKANTMVVGLAINTLAGGATISLMKAFFGTRGSIISAKIVGLPQIHLPFADRLGPLGELLSGYTPFVYLSFLLVFVVGLVFYRTRLGLYVRVIGEKEEAAESLGINVVRIKYAAAALCGVFCGFAGAHLSLGYITMFTENMSSGRGFMALAALIFSDGEPGPLLAGCLLFGLTDALAMRLQGYGVPSYIVLMFPYLVTLAFLFIISYRRRPKIFKELQEALAAPAAKSQNAH